MDINLQYKLTGGKLKVKTDVKVRVKENLFDNMTKCCFGAGVQVFSTTPTCNVHIIRLFLLNKINPLLLRAPV